MGVWGGKVEKINMDLLLTNPIQIYKILSQFNKDLPWGKYMQYDYNINANNREHQ